jgi:CTP synthase (UTP-ammonia lyase)
MDGEDASPITIQKADTNLGEKVTRSCSGLIICERHRHRYEVNPEYISPLTSHGIIFVRKGDTGKRMEILELRDHPWFVGVQFHPEYLSRVLEPSRPYLGFSASSAGCFDEIVQKTWTIEWIAVDKRVGMSSFKALKKIWYCSRS